MHPVIPARLQICTKQRAGIKQATHVRPAVPLLCSSPQHAHRCTGYSGPRSGRSAVRMPCTVFLRYWPATCTGMPCGLHTATASADWPTTCRVGGGGVLQGSGLVSSAEPRRRDARPRNSCIKSTRAKGEAGLRHNISSAHLDGPRWHRRLMAVDEVPHALTIPQRRLSGDLRWRVGRGGRYTAGDCLPNFWAGGLQAGSAACSQQVCRRWAGQGRTSHPSTRSRPSARA